ncbi:hypothetical protein [Streptomyces sp. NPDC055210]
MLLADGGETVPDRAVLPDQPEAFGPVIYTHTARRLLADTGEAVLTWLCAARSNVQSHG